MDSLVISFFIMVILLNSGYTRVTFVTNGHAYDITHFNTWLTLTVILMGVHNLRHDFHPNYVKYLLLSLNQLVLPARITISSMVKEVITLWKRMLTWCDCYGLSVREGL